MDNRNHDHAIYFDFAKAFDKVLHVLLHKLTSVEIHPRIVQWIQDFLSDRTFQVRVGNEASSSP